HPSYNRRRMVHDIGLLYLAHNVQFSRTIRPICLPTSASLRSKSFVGYTPFVAGWGKTQESGTSSNILQHLSIPVLTNEQCRDTYAKKGRRISEEMFGPSVLCAGHLAGGNDTCQGDSGGPMMIVDGDPSQRRYYQIGIVSYGIGCARRDAPGVYTNIQYFMGWIIDMVDDES
ncbi:CG43336, partial [Drosophila busckii]